MQNKKSVKNKKTALITNTNRNNGWEKWRGTRKTCL